jgi:hypothetical protein
MRNVFDQYQHPENRLTHALACCLDADPRLMRSFLSFVMDKDGGGQSDLRIVEQQLPGMPADETEESANGSLPDAWIYGESDWALLIEAKVQSKIELGQLKRHLATADKRGFSAAQLLLLSIESPKSLPERCTHHYWTAVYRWAIGQARASVGPSEWARRFADFMEVTEGRMLSAGYLKEGTLTAFSGIHFDNGNPYSYTEAKRLLRLMMDHLRNRPSLASKLGVNPLGTGRGAITGKSSDAVWDFLRLSAAGTDESFTKYPHLTVAIENDHALAQVTIPNGLDGSLVRKLKAAGYEAFKGLIFEFLRNVEPILTANATATPFVKVVQRHYPSQRSVPIYDASLELDPRTAFDIEDTMVKFQEQWLRTAFDVFANRRSNIQIGIGVKFPYGDESAVRDSYFISIVEQSLLASEPFLRTMGLTPSDSH